MPDLELNADPREVLGKNVAKLRRRGLTPANIYGHNVASQAIQVPTLELNHTLRAAGATHLLQLSLSSEDSPRMVLVRNVSRKPTNDQLLHVDFYQVSMTEKTTVEVPIILTGSAPVAETGEGMVLQVVQMLLVECLPRAIPDRIEADLSSLADLHSALHVSDLRLPSGVTTAVDPSDIIVSVNPRLGAEEAGAAAEAAAEEAATEPS
jgi:large subunit ribosomal protein L25